MGGIWSEINWVRSYKHFNRYMFVHLIFFVLCTEVWNWYLFKISKVRLGVLCETTDPIRINVPDITYRYLLSEFLTADHWKLLLKFVVHIFTLLLPPLVPKLINYSRHSDFFKYVWKSTKCCNQKGKENVVDFGNLTNV